MKAQAFDEAFEAGGDLLQHLELAKATRPGQVWHG
jgi:hypothetical protein